MKTAAGRRCAMTFAGATLAAFCWGIQPASSQTQSYPSRPIRFVVPFAPGGATDTIARTVAQKSTESLGQQVIVDNRPGANGNIGMEMVARAAPDGYTIVLGYMANLAIAPGFEGKLPFDPVKDFAPITLAVGSPTMFVANPSLPAKTFKEFIAYAKANPNRVNYGTSSVAVVVIGELLKSVAGIEMQHIPYKGTAQAVVDVLSGQIQTMFASSPSVLPHIKAGKLRPLAVTGTRRWSAVPDVPTIAESGYAGFEATVWFGILAPAGTPTPVITRLHGEFAKALTAPESRERLDVLGFDILARPPEEFRRYIQAEIAKWTKVIKSSGLKPE